MILILTSPPTATWVIPTSRSQQSSSHQTPSPVSPNYTPSPSRASQSISSHASQPALAICQQRSLSTVPTPATDPDANSFPVRSAPRVLAAAELVAPRSRAGSEAFRLRVQQLSVVAAVHADASQFENVLQYLKRICSL